MALIRWSPPRVSAHDIDTFHDEVNRLFNGVLVPGAGGAFAPAVDIEETAERFVVRMDLPGVSQSEVKVVIQGDVLTIRGDRQTATESKDAKVYRRERRFGSFERSFKLGRSVKTDQVQATTRDGVLEVQIPKSDESRVREIPVQ